MKRLIECGGLALLAFMVVLSAPSTGFSVNSSEIETNLMCDCGCGQLLSTCACGRAAEMRSMIRTMLDEGRSKEEILDSFVARYGERILSVPPKKGFNLVAYIAPFLGLLVGVGIAVVLARRWVFTGSREVREGGTTGGAALSEDVEKKIEDELKRFEEDE